MEDYNYFYNSNYTQLSERHSNFKINPNKIEVQKKRFVAAESEVGTLFSAMSHAIVAAIPSNYNAIVNSFQLSKHQFLIPLPVKVQSRKQVVLKV